MGGGEHIHLYDPERKDPHDPWAKAKEHLNKIYPRLSDAGKKIVEAIQKNLQRDETTQQVSSTEEQLPTFGKTKKIGGKKETATGQEYEQPVPATGLVNLQERFREIQNPQLSTEEQLLILEGLRLFLETTQNTNKEKKQIEKLKVAYVETLKVPLITKLLELKAMTPDAKAFEELTRLQAQIDQAKKRDNKDLLAPVQNSYISTVQQYIPTLHITNLTTEKQYYTAALEVAKKMRQQDIANMTTDVAIDLTGFQKQLTILPPENPLRLFYKTLTNGKTPDEIHQNLYFKLVNMRFASTAEKDKEATYDLYQFLISQQKEERNRLVIDIQTALTTLPPGEKEYILGRLVRTTLAPSLEVANQKMIAYENGHQPTWTKEEVGNAQVALMMWHIYDNTRLGRNDPLIDIDGIFLPIDPNTPEGQEKLQTLETTRFMYALGIHHLIPTAFDILQAVGEKLSKKAQEAGKDISPLFYKKQLMGEFIKLYHPLYTERIQISPELLQNYFVTIANTALDPTMVITFQGLHPKDQKHIPVETYKMMLEQMIFSQLLRKYLTTYDHLYKQVQAKDKDIYHKQMALDGCNEFLNLLDTKLAADQKNYGALLEKYNTFQNGPFFQFIGAGFVSDQQLTNSFNAMNSTSHEILQSLPDQAKLVDATGSANLELLKAEFALLNFQLSKTHIVPPGSTLYKELLLQRQSCVVRCAQLGSDIYRQAEATIPHFAQVANSVLGKERRFIQAARTNDYSGFFSHPTLDDPKKRDINAWIDNRGIRCGGNRGSGGYDQEVIRELFHAGKAPSGTGEKNGPHFTRVLGPDNKPIYLELSGLRKSCKLEMLSFEGFKSMIGMQEGDMLLLRLFDTDCTAIQQIDDNNQRTPYYKILNPSAFEVIRPLSYNNSKEMVYFSKQVPDGIDRPLITQRNGFDFDKSTSDKKRSHISSQRKINLDRKNNLQTPIGGYDFNGWVPVTTDEVREEQTVFDQLRIQTLAQHPVLIQSQNIARQIQATFGPLLVSPPGQEYSPQIIQHLMSDEFRGSLQASIKEIRSLLLAKGFQKGVEQFKEMSSAQKKQLGVTDQIEAELEVFFAQIDHVADFFAPGGQAEYLIRTLANKAHRDVNSMAVWLKGEGAILITVLIISIATMGLTAGVLPGIAGILFSSTMGAIAGVAAGEVATQGLNHFYQNTALGRSLAGVRSFQNFEISTPFLERQKSIQSNMSRQQKEELFCSMIGSYGKQVLTQVGMNMGIRAFAECIGRPALQSVVSTTNKRKQAFGNQRGQAKTKVANRCKSNTSLTALFKDMAGSPFMQKVISKWAAASTGLKQISHQLNAGELQEELIEETVWEKIAEELAGPYGSFLVGAFGSSVEGSTGNSHTDPLEAFGVSVTAFTGGEEDDNEVTGELELSFDQEQQQALITHLQQTGHTIEMQAGGFTATKNGLPHPITFTPSTIPVALRNAFSNGNGQDNTGNNDQHNNRFTKPNSDVVTMFNTPTTEFQTTLTPEELSLLGGQACMVDNHIFTGEEIFIFGAETTTQTLQNRLDELLVEHLSDHKDIWAALHSGLQSLASFRSIAENSSGPLRTDSEAGPFVEAMLALDAAVSRTEPSGEVSVQIRTLFAQLLCPELMSQELIGYSSLEELINTAHTEPNPVLKGLILRRAGLSTAQTKILMRLGICGRLDSFTDKLQTFRDHIATNWLGRDTNGTDVSQETPSPELKELVDHAFFDGRHSEDRLADFKDFCKKNRPDATHIDDLELNPTTLVAQAQQLTELEANADPRSFTLGGLEPLLVQAIQDATPYLQGKTNLHIMDAFCGVASLSNVIPAWDDAFDVASYLAVDILNTSAPGMVGEAALQAAKNSGINTGFLQTDALSALQLMPGESLDVLLLNGIDFTITNDAYMAKVLQQAAKVLAPGGIISGIMIGSEFLNQAFVKKHMGEGYTVHESNAGIFTIVKEKTEQVPEVAQAPLKVEATFFSTPEQRKKLSQALIRNKLKKEDIFGLRAQAMLPEGQKIPDDIDIEYSKKNGYDVFDVSLNLGTNSHISYELRCKGDERFMVNKYIITNKEDYPNGGVALKVLGQQIQAATKIHCHAIYGECAYGRNNPLFPRNGAYTRGVMGFEFDEYNEMGRKTEGQQHDRVINQGPRLHDEYAAYLEENKKPYVSVSTLAELFAQPDGASYRKKHAFTFQGVFKLPKEGIPSISMNRFNEYKKSREDPKQKDGTNELTLDYLSPKIQIEFLRNVIKNYFTLVYDHIRSNVPNLPSFEDYLNHLNKSNKQFGIFSTLNTENIAKLQERLKTLTTEAENNRDQLEAMSSFIENFRASDLNWYDPKNWNRGPTPDHIMDLEETTLPDATPLLEMHQTFQQVGLVGIAQRLDAGNVLTNPDAPQALKDLVGQLLRVNDEPTTRALVHQLALLGFFPPTFTSTQVDEIATLAREVHSMPREGRSDTEYNQAKARALNKGLEKICSAKEATTIARQLMRLGICGYVEQEHAGDIRKQMDLQWGKGLYHMDKSSIRLWLTNNGLSPTDPQVISLFANAVVCGREYLLELMARDITPQSLKLLFMYGYARHAIPDHVDINAYIEHNYLVTIADNTKRKSFLDAHFLDVGFDSSVYVDNRENPRSIFKVYHNLSPANIALYYEGMKKLDKHLDHMTNGKVRCYTGKYDIIGKIGNQQILELDYIPGKFSTDADLQEQEIAGLILGFFGQMEIPTPLPSWLPGGYNIRYQDDGTMVITDMGIIHEFITKYSEKEKKEKEQTPETNESPNTDPRLEQGIENLTKDISEAAPDMTRPVLLPGPDTRNNILKTRCAKQASVPPEKILKLLKEIPRFSFQLTMKLLQENPDISAGRRIFLATQIKGNSKMNPVDILRSHLPECTGKAEIIHPVDDSFTMERLESLGLYDQGLDSLVYTSATDSDHIFKCFGRRLSHADLDTYYTALAELNTGRKKKYPGSNISFYHGTHDIVGTLGNQTTPDTFIKLDKIDGKNMPSLTDEQHKNLETYLEQTLGFLPSINPYNMMLTPDGQIVITDVDDINQFVTEYKTRHPKNGEQQQQTIQNLQETYQKSLHEAEPKLRILLGQDNALVDNFLSKAYPNIVAFYYRLSTIPDYTLNIQAMDLLNLHTDIMEKLASLPGQLTEDKKKILADALYAVYLRYDNQITHSDLLLADDIKILLMVLETEIDYILEEETPMQETPDSELVSLQEKINKIANHEDILLLFPLFAPYESQLLDLASGSPREDFDMLFDYKEYFTDMLKHNSIPVIKEKLNTLLGYVNKILKPTQEMPDPTPGTETQTLVISPDHVTKIVEDMRNICIMSTRLQFRKMTNNKPTEQEWKELKESADVWAYIRQKIQQINENPDDHGDYTITADERALFTQLNQDKLADLQTQMQHLLATIEVERTTLTQEQIASRFRQIMEDAGIDPISTDWKHGGEELVDIEQRLSSPKKQKDREALAYNMSDQLAPDERAAQALKVANTYLTTPKRTALGNQKGAIQTLVLEAHMSHNIQDTDENDQLLRLNPSDNTIPKRTRNALAAKLKMLKEGLTALKDENGSPLLTEKEVSDIAKAWMKEGLCGDTKEGLKGVGQTYLGLAQTFVSLYNEANDKTQFMQSTDHSFCYDPDKIYQQFNVILSWQNQLPLEQIFSSDQLKIYIEAYKLLKPHFAADNHTSFENSPGANLLEELLQESIFGSKMMDKAYESNALPLGARATSYENGTLTYQHYGQDMSMSSDQLWHGLLYHKDLIPELFSNGVDALHRDLIVEHSCVELLNMPSAEALFLWLEDHTDARTVHKISRAQCKIIFDTIQRYKADDKILAYPAAQRLFDENLSADEKRWFEKGITKEETKLLLRAYPYLEKYVEFLGVDFELIGTGIHGLVVNCGNGQVAKIPRKDALLDIFKQEFDKHTAVHKRFRRCDNENFPNVYVPAVEGKINFNGITYIQYQEVKGNSVLISYAKQHYQQELQTKVVDLGIFTQEQIDAMNDHELRALLAEHLGVDEAKLVNMADAAIKNTKNKYLPYDAHPRRALALLEQVKGPEVAQQVYNFLAALGTETMMTHGDLHGDNILIDNEGRIAIIDRETQ